MHKKRRKKVTSFTEPIQINSNNLVNQQLVISDQDKKNKIQKANMVKTLKFN